MFMEGRSLYSIVCMLWFLVVNGPYSKVWPLCGLVWLSLWYGLVIWSLWYGGVIYGLCGVVMVFMVWIPVRTVW